MEFLIFGIFVAVGIGVTITSGQRRTAQQSGPRDEPGDEVEDEGSSNESGGDVPTLTELDRPRSAPAMTESEAPAGGNEDAPPPTEAHSPLSEAERARIVEEERVRHEARRALEDRERRTEAPPATPSPPRAKTSGCAWLALIVLVIMGIGSISNRDAGAPRTTTPSPRKVAGTNWQIVSEQDVSFASVRRVQINVRMTNASASQAEIRAAAEEIISARRGGTDAIAFFFEKAPYPAIVARGFWAPYGDWGRAMEKTAQQLTIDFE